MKRTTVEIPVRVPYEVVRPFVQELAEDKNLAQAYFKLRGTTSPSRVVESTPERIVIYEPSFDPSSRAHGVMRTGWTVTYTLRALPEGETAVEIAIEYNRMTALLGIGLIKVQAENEVIHRISALLSFENGYHAERGAPAQEARLLEAVPERLEPVPARPAERAAKK